MNCNFTEGQEVVCIDDIFNDFWKTHIPFLPKLNEKYTIRKVVIETFIDEPEGIPALLLVELINPILDFHGELEPHEMPFAYWRFRPIKKAEAKISKSKYDFNTLLNVREEDAVQFEDELETLK
jgi:hypothetical protein